MRVLMLLLFFVITASAAFFGSQFMPDAWYQGLSKPSWNPPNWVFGPVWTALYIMIAIAGWLAWRVQGFGPAVLVWLTGIVLNGLWSYLFFGLHRIDLAFADIVALWLSIVAFIALAWGVSRSAALLFVPYLAWVSFASALNWTIWRLNP